MKRRMTPSPLSDARFTGLGLILGVVGLVLLSLGLGGCDDDEGDVIPPATPDGVTTITGDQEIWVLWNANREPDLAGYRVWWTADVDADFRPIHWKLRAESSTPTPNFSYFNYDPDDLGGRPYLTFIDGAASGSPLTNGVDYYYAISAFDLSGNESPLSTDLAVDTPRPEGIVSLGSASSAPSTAGFDFSDELVRPADDISTDLIYDWVDGLPLLRANFDWVRIQDYGYVDFDVASWAPAFGWSATGEVEAIVGHTYILEIIDGEDLNYAKVEVRSLSGTAAELRWGYQTVVGLPELSVPGETRATGLAQRKEGTP
jgi:hypothetical protein